MPCKRSPSPVRDEAPEVGTARKRCEGEEGTSLLIDLNIPAGPVTPAELMTPTEVRSEFSDFSARSETPSQRRKRRAVLTDEDVSDDEERLVIHRDREVEKSSRLAALEAPALGVEIVQAVNRVSDNLQKCLNVQGSKMR